MLAKGLKTMVVECYKCKVNSVKKKTEVLCSSTMTASGLMLLAIIMVEEVSLEPGFAVGNAFKNGATCASGY